MCHWHPAGSVVLSKVGDLQIKMRFFPVVVVVCISNSPFFVYAKKKNVKNVGARWAGFNISKLVDLPGTISEVFQERIHKVTNVLSVIVSVDKNAFCTFQWTSNWMWSWQLTERGHIIELLSLWTVGTLCWLCKWVTCLENRHLLYYFFLVVEKKLTKTVKKQTLPGHSSIHLDRFSLQEPI